MSDWKHIATGWDGYRQIVVPADATEEQLAECRQAYYAGAAVLFQTLLLALDPTEDQEPTERDLQIMASLQEEVDEFGLALDLKLLPVGGHG